MAIYTTFFLCEQLELQPAFPGWKLPLAKPTIRVTKNPFTGEQITIESRAPAWDDVDPDELPSQEMSVVAIQGDYAAYLENRIPPFVRSKPHWCAKSLTSVELEPLIFAAVSDDGVVETALYARPGLGAGIERLPDEFTNCLKHADEIALNKIAEKWAAEMSTPDCTHSVGGTRVQDDMTVGEAMSVISRLAELAKKHEKLQSMYLLTEA